MLPAGCLLLRSTIRPLGDPEDKKQYQFHLIKNGLNRIQPRTMSLGGAELPTKRMLSGLLGQCRYNDAGTKQESKTGNDLKHAPLKWGELSPFLGKDAFVGVLIDCKSEVYMNCEG